MRKIRILAICLLLSPGSAAFAAEPAWTSYARLLGRYVSQGTISGVRLAAVDYSGLKSDAVFQQVVKQIADYPAANLQTPKEKLAFYINAYNILAIKTVIDHWPVESIKDVGSLLRPVWKRPAGQVTGKTVSLDEIENEVLRTMGEPRIHMAIVCASLSCPDLRSEPYTAAHLDQQLNAASHAYMNNPTKGLRIEKGVAKVSKIFDWFEDDFTVVGGIEAFIRSHHRGLSPGLTITPDLPYDWSLNGR